MGERGYSLTRNEELLEKRISDPVIEIHCDGIYRHLYCFCAKHGWSEDQIDKILYRKERLVREK